MHQVDHFAFRVSDPELAIHFYRDLLGLKLLSKTVDTDHHEAFAFLELKGGNLELLWLLDENNQPLAYQKPLIEPPYCPHLALKTKNLNQRVIDLRQKNIRIINGPLEIPNMVKWLYIADPDHNIIEFVQWINP